jgi:hypothetical protein
LGVRFGASRRFLALLLPSVELLLFALLLLWMFLDRRSRLYQRMRRRGSTGCALQGRALGFIGLRRMRNIGHSRRGWP